MLNKSFSSLIISGRDAANFLQGQLTCDVKKITPENSCYGARCNLQGRVIFLAKIYLRDDKFILVMPTEMIAIALQEFKKFVLRSKVTFEQSSEQIPNKNVEGLKQGIAWIVSETSEKYLPHELNYQNIGAINFDKGCYIGQEIVARMHYRAELKKQLVLLEVENKDALKVNYNDKLKVIADDKTECDFEIVDFENDNNKLYLLGVLYKKDLVPTMLKVNEQIYKTRAINFI